MAEGGDEGSGAGEEVWRLGGEIGDADVAGEEGLQVAEDGGLADAAATVEDDAGAAGAEHDLLLKLFGDAVAGDEGFAVLVHRVAGAEVLRGGFAGDFGLDLVELELGELFPLERVPLAAELGADLEAFDVEERFSAAGLEAGG